MRMEERQGTKEDERETEFQSLRERMEVRRKNSKTNRQKFCLKSFKTRNTSIFRSSCFTQKLVIAFLIVPQDLEDRWRDISRLRKDRKREGKFGHFLKELVQTSF